MIMTMDAFWTGSFPDEIQKQNSYYRRRYGWSYKLEQDLINLGSGYMRESQIAPGQFAVRGNYLFFLLRKRCRWIELWGDEIDSICMFDAKSQRSIENIRRSQFIRLRKIVWNNDLVSFWKYFPENETLLFMMNRTDCRRRRGNSRGGIYGKFENRADAGMKEEGEEELRVFRQKDIISEMNRYSGIGFDNYRIKMRFI